MSLILEITIVPRSKGNAISLDEHNILKIHVKSPAEKGKANRELIEILSKLLKIPQRNISIILGAMARKKRIKIETELPKEAIIYLLTTRASLL